MPFVEREHDYEPRAVEGWLGPAVLSGKGFYFHGEDAAEPGNPRPSQKGGRIDLSAVARGFTHLKVTASATDAAWADIKREQGWPEKPSDVILTAEAGNGDDATTYLAGYDFGVPTPFARVSRRKVPKPIVRGAVAEAALSSLSSSSSSKKNNNKGKNEKNNRSTINSRAAGGSATWFGLGNHLRLEGEADLFGGAAVGWATYTLNEDADLVNSTAVNLVERERGFVVSPFTVATATAAAGVEARLGRAGGRDDDASSSSYSSSSSGQWKGAFAYDFNKCAPYVAVAREVSRVPRWLRRVAPPATSGRGLVGGGGRSRSRSCSSAFFDDEDEDEEGQGIGARIAAHLSPVDRVAMLTFELGGGAGGSGGGGGGILAGGGSGKLSSSPSPSKQQQQPVLAPFKAFVRARTDGKGFRPKDGVRGLLSGLSGGIIVNHTIEI